MIEQRSFDWHEWRKQGLGSSDAAVVMGVSPWRTPLQLWEEKTGKVAVDEKSNWAMQRGIDMEPKARAQYELHSDIEMPPALVVNATFPFLRASLDGRNEKAKRILEIKCPGAEDHAKAVAGEIPEKYKWQLVHQLLVTGDDGVDYFSFNGKEGVIVKFERDLRLEKSLFEEESKFWDLVQKGVAPELCERDFKLVKDKDTVFLCEQFKQAKIVLEQTEEALEFLKSKIVLSADGNRIRCAGVQVMPVTRKGNVDYAKVPELRGIDLEKYRKKASLYIDVRLTKE